jgi:hypothetical protein
LVDERTPAGIADGIRRLFADLPERSETVRYSEQFRWEPTSVGQLKLFESIKYAA